MKSILVLWLCLLTPWAWGQTSLWQVSKGPHQLLLAASVPLLSRDDYPLPQAFEQAYQIADRVYFQTDIGALNQPQFAARAMQAMMYRDGRNLRSVLSSDVWAQLQAFTARRNLPVATLLMFKPAFTVMSLTLLETKRLGFGQGVDGHFYGRAKKSGKAMAFLEPVERQLQWLDRLNTLDPDTLIDVILNELDAMPETAEPLVAAWRQGKTDRLHQLTSQKLLDQSPAIYQSLVIERNRAWLARLEAMLNSPELEFIVVDALHLTGPEGLLQMLREQGFELTPYRPH